jgi:hypothetical protein
MTILSDMESAMANAVFLLWHVHHIAGTDTGQVKHFERPDDFWADEQAGDDVKLLGVYSSREKAAARIKDAATLNGFREEPLCFYVSEYVVDQDHWPEGYVSVGGS